MITDLLELITKENIYELQPGDWIWDNKLIERRAHKRTLSNETITEPIGFRQIHILDIDTRYGLVYSKPFMLSNNHDSWYQGSNWEIFELNRYYKFKKEVKTNEKIHT